MPRLQVINDDYSEHGFISIAINVGDDMATLKTWARQYTNLYLLDNGTVWPVYTLSNSIPLNYVIDSSGVIRYIAEGFDEAQVRTVIQQWLPDPIVHDVGATRIFAPAGNFDSTQTATPACSLYNYGTTAENYSVRMRIGTMYDTAVTVTAHAPGTLRYVEFPQWTALERGTLVVKCSTELAGDDIRSNDPAVGQAIVRVYDMAVTAILAPGDSADSGTAVVPAAEVRNLGSVADMMKVRFFIGDGYADSVNVPLQPGRTDTAFLPQWTPLARGTFAVRCSVSGRWEMVPDNNQLVDTVVVVANSAVEETPVGGAGFAVQEPMPNPSAGKVVIGYTLPRSLPVSFRVYTAGGALVRVLGTGFEAAGTHSVAWDGRDDAGNAVGPGVYYLRLDAGEFSAARKLVRTDQ